MITIANPGRMRFTRPSTPLRVVVLHSDADVCAHFTRCWSIYGIVSIEGGKYKNITTVFILPTPTFNLVYSPSDAEITPPPRPPPSTYAARLLSVGQD